MNRNIRKLFSKSVKWVVALINLALVVLFIASAWGGTVNPNSFVFAAGLALMFPIFLALMVVAVVATLIWFRKLAVINIIAVLLCGSQILSYIPLNFMRASETEIAESRDCLLKVLSFNVYGFTTYGSENHEGENPTMDYILNTDADILLLQEADGFAMHRVADEQILQLDSLYQYSDITHRGMAIYSKYPIEVVPVSVTDKAQLDLLRYDVTLPGGRLLHLFNVHMQSIGLTADDKHLYEEMTSGETPIDTDKIRFGLLSKLAAAFRSRANQAEEIRCALDSVSGDVILAGDFNDVPGSYACLTVQGDDMKDAYRQSGLGPAITYHANRFYFRIDHMFYRGALVPIRAERGDCTSSDHYPLISIFKLQH